MEISKETSNAIIQDLTRTIANAAKLKDPNEKRSNTLSAVTKLLTDLLDPEAAKIMLAASKGTSASIGVGGIGTKGNNQFLPSFNVRTPVMEIFLNGQEIYPNKLDLDSGLMVPARLNFESFNISFPMGGVEKSITGTMQLFAKDPKEILLPLDVFNSQNGVPGGETSTGGFPIVSVRFGWAFSDSTVGGDKVSKAMSPRLTFIATNIGMSDPGTAGTTFTLSLQEIGNVILEHSSDDVIIMSDYPQQQLRLLLEGLLHVRLFTLDDLLYLGEKNNLGALSLDLSVPKVVKVNPDAKPLIQPLTKPDVTSTNAPLTKPVIPTTSVFDMATPGYGIGPQSVGTVQPKPPQSTIDKVNDYVKAGGTLDQKVWGFVKFGGKIDQAVYQFFRTDGTLDKFIGANPLRAVGLADEAAPAAPAASTPTTTNQSTKSNGPSSESLSSHTGWTESTKTSKTFFVTKESAAVGINARTFFTVAKELASQCRCKWYPHDNTEEATKADAEETSEATNKLAALAKDLKMVRDTEGSTLSVDLSTSIRNNFNAKNKDTTTKLQKSKAEQDLTAELKKTMARLSTRSKLFWVPHVPSTWNTTGSAYYAAGTGETAIPYEAGAFFLLPDVLDDYDIFLSDLPICYGPGASALPYFYGSGQNVFQTSLDTSPSKMFGEVQTLSVNHSSLIVALSQAADEKLAYAVNGKRMGQLEAALAYKSSGNVNINNTLIREDSSENYKEAEKVGEKKLEDARKLQAFLRGKLKSSRFKSSAGTGTSGTLLVLDMTEINGKPLSGSEKSMSGAADPDINKTGQAQSTTYNIKSRVASFLRYPTEAKITILGDPNLIRLGPGCLELISYYPVQHDNGTITHEINGLTSGIYFVSKIDHAISGGSFITSISGQKLKDPASSPSSFTNQLINQLLASKTIKKDKKSEGITPNNQINSVLPDQLAVVDLTDPKFTSGFLSTELNRIFNIYTTTNNKLKSAN
ncbi:MAG: hypothetical protein JHC33_04295 [Ignisphaera sp.]|nr:hypothetical protein [Ignisphaera sp.]